MAYISTPTVEKGPRFHSVSLCLSMDKVMMSFIMHQFLIHERSSKMSYQSQLFPSKLIIKRIFKFFKPTHKKDTHAETPTNTQTQLHSQNNTQTHKHTNTQTCKHTNTQKYKCTNTQKHKCINTQAYKHTETKTQKHTKTQTHNNTNVQTHSIQKIIKGLA